MNCTFISDEQLCEAEDATIFMNFLVCDEHKQLLIERMCYTSQRTALQAAKHHGLSDFPGWCYIVLLPDATIKIGYSNTDELLRKRIQSLSSEYKAPVIELLRVKGGFVAEAVIHKMFSDYRLPGTGERFTYSPAIAKYIAEYKGK